MKRVSNSECNDCPPVIDIKKTLKQIEGGGGVSRDFKFRAWYERDKIMDYNPKWGSLFEPFSQEGLNKLQINELFKSGIGVLQQYTGLKDKNGKEIWEGDILRGFSYPFLNDGNENYVAVVQWDKDLAGFFSYPQRISNRVSGCACQDYVFDNGQESAKQFERIGSIYENPELMEVGE